MKEPVCQVVSKEELVAYADGDLPPNQAERIAAHVAHCQSCRTMLDALERSLHITQAIWRTGEARWPETRSFETPQRRRRWLRPVAAVAAGVLLVLGVAAIWRLRSESSQTPRFVGKEPTAAEIEVAANRAALASQMLAVAELLSSQPGGTQYAVRRYNDVITSFPGTEQSMQARRCLERLSERR